MKVFVLLICVSISAGAQNLKQEKEFDKVEISDGHCQIREATITKKDGSEIARSYRRWAVEPDGDLSQFDSRIKAICRAAWTPEVIKLHKEQVKKTRNL